MDVPVYKKLLDLDNHHGNPYATKRGHLPISVEEPWELRLARMGLIKTIATPSAGVAMTQGSFTQIWDMSAATFHANHSIVPLRIMLAANGPGVAQFNTVTDTNVTQNHEYYFSDATGGCWDWKTNGLLWIASGRDFFATFKATNTGTVAWFNMAYVEVPM